MLLLIFAGIVVLLVFLWAVTIVFGIASAIDDKYPRMQGAANKIGMVFYYAAIIGVIIWVKVSL